MRITLLFALSAVSTVGCADGNQLSDKSMRIKDFEITQVAADGSIAITPDTAGTVYVNRYAAGPDAPRKGTSVLVLHPTTKAPILEAIDVDGDGYWDTVRYLAKTDSGLLRTEDNDGDGRIDARIPQ